MTKNYFKFFLIVFLAFGLTSALTAQGKLGGSITGKVTDDEGNALPGCTITVRGPALQGEITFVATETGTFRFPMLPPGSDYEATIQMPGFKTSIQQGLQVSVGKTTNVSVTLEMSAQEEEITVLAESPAVDVKQSKTAVNYSKAFIYNIPMSRDLYDVLNSMPGSVSEGVTYRRTSYVAGGTVRGNQYSLDGVIINDPVVMYPMTNINIDVYEEVEMGLFGHSAEVGIADGGYVNIVTKSGGNEFHGGATVEYYGEGMVESLLSAEDLEAVGQEKPAGWSKWQDFSVFIGGPIVKDRVWFFTNGRFFKWAQDFDHRIYDASVAAGTSIYTVDEAPHEEYNAFGKLTFQLSPNMRLMATYNLAKITEEFYTNRIGSYNDVTATTKWDNEMGHTLSGQLNWVMNQNLFIDARIGYIGRTFPIPYSDSALPNEPRLYDRYYSIYRNNARFAETYLRHRFNPSVTATLFMDNVMGANHEMKFGVEYEATDGNWDWWRDNPWYMYTYKGSLYSYTTSSYDNRGRIRAYTAGPAEGTTVEHDEMKRIGLFVQDSITIAERLTLNLGVRYDSSKGSFPAQHHNATVDPLGVLAILKGSSTAWDEYDFPKYDVLTWAHLSPRVGFSYDVFGDGKTSIKGSWSRYNEYLMIQYFSLANPMYPSNGSWYWFDDNYNMQVDAGDSFTMQFMPVDPLEFVLEDEINLDASAPYTDEFTFGIDRELARDFRLGATFVYKHKQNVFEDVNDFGLDEAWKGYRPDSPYWDLFTFNDPGDDGEFGNADDITSRVYARLAGAPATHYYLTNVEGAFRKYMALQIIASKRMSNRWQLMGSLTWSKAWGNIAGDYGSSYGASGTFDNPNSFLFDQERMNYDRPINIKLQSTVMLPLDIILSGYFNHRSGSPWDRDVDVTIPDDPKWKYPANVWSVSTEENGTRRNPPLTTLDLRIEKRFRFGDRFSVGGYVDIINALGRSGYTIESNPGGYLDYSDPSNPTFERYGGYGDVETAYGNRTIKVSFRFTF